MRLARLVVRIMLTALSLILLVTIWTFIGPEEHLKELDTIKRSTDRELLAAASEPKDVMPVQVPKQRHVYDVEKHSVFERLNPALVANVVYYTWCDRKMFEFHNYLGLLSIIKELRPEAINVFYETWPMIDKWWYNTWFKELKDTYPFIKMHKLAVNNTVCLDGKANETFIYEKLQSTGGIYMHEDTILNYLPLNFRRFAVMDGWNTTSGEGIIIAQKNVHIKTLLSGGYTRKAMPSITCVSIEDFNETPTQTPVCVLAPNSFDPVDVWKGDDKFSRLCRRLFYDSEDLPQPVYDTEHPVPNIAHLVWIGGYEVDFLFYLCAMSLLHIVKVDKLYVHGDLPPKGPYWEKLKRNRRIVNLLRQMPTEVFGHIADKHAHQADILRVEIMIQYGGIYIDTDAIFVKPLDMDMRAYEAMGSPDWVTDLYRPFPDEINAGVMIGKPGGRYWKAFQKSMYYYDDQLWSWNSQKEPYKVYERHPDYFVLNRHLQVICYELRCHPTWWPHYNNVNINHETVNSLPNWRQDAYVYHFTSPTPSAFWNEENLLREDNIFAEMGRYILNEAGLLDVSVVKSKERTDV